ncbi:MAG: JAB domain-containing protein, partial [Christensenellales bacterium]
HNLASPNVYIVHNHPSGEATPSVKDIEFTKWAAASLEMLGVRLIDHLIVAKQQVYSFEKDGKLNDFRDKYYEFMFSQNISDKK